MHKKQTLGAFALFEIKTTEINPFISNRVKIGTPRNAHINQLKYCLQLHLKSIGICSKNLQNK